MIEMIENNREWIEATWEKTERKLRKVAVKSRNKLPYTTIDGVHDNKFETEPDWWTNGFWGGMMWLLYKETQNEEYKITAQRCEQLMDAALNDFPRLQHDVGFLWHLTSGANYRITGDEKAYTKNLFMASTLASRYNIDGKYIRAWNFGDKYAGMSIIDCMMNLSLLYWASDEIGDKRFKRIAMSHADMAIRDHIRADGSVNHIVEHDTETGEVVKIHSGQGYSDTSCWSRGLAWAVYGSVISYIHTGKQEYLDSAVKTANYFIVNCAASDYLSVVDFKAPTEPVYYDSTAGLCTACGLLELAKFVSESEARTYVDAAIKILKATDKTFCNYSDEEDSLVGMGTERYPSEGNMKGVHIPIIYGDFFYVEALLKLKGSDFLIW